MPGPPLAELRVGHRVHLGQRSVGVVPGQVDAPDLLQREQRGLRGDLLPPDLLGPLPRLGGGVPEDDGDPGHDPEVVGAPAVRRQAAFHVGVEGASRLEGAVPGEDHVRRGGGELPALVGVARLDHHRVPLRGAGQGELARDVEVPAVMGEGAGGAVGVPGVPQRPRRGHELGGAGVAIGPVQVAAAPEVLAGEGVGGGHHVPGGPAAAEVVQGGEPAGEFVGLVERGVDRGGESEASGDRGQRVEHGQGLGAADHVQVVEAALVLTQPQPLGEEEEVEQTAFGGAREVLEGGEVDLRARARIGPDGGVVDAGEVRGEVHPFRPPRLRLSRLRLRRFRLRRFRSGHDAPCVTAYWLAGRARPRWSRSVLPG